MIVKSLSKKLAPFASLVVLICVCGVLATSVSDVDTAHAEESTVKATGVVEAGKTKLIKFTNTLNTSLSVTQAVTNEYVNDEGPFLYEMTLTDESGAPYAGKKAFSIERKNSYQDAGKGHLSKLDGNDSASGEIDFATNGGVVRFQLLPTDKFTLEGLPVGTKFSLKAIDRTIFDNTFTGAGTDAGDVRQGEIKVGSLVPSVTGTDVFVFRPQVNKLVALGDKSLVGDWDFANKQFVFALTSVDGAVDVGNGSNSTDTSGKVTWIGGELRDSGEYKYQVKENGGDLSGVTYDDGTHELKVTMNDH